MALRQDQFEKLTKRDATIFLDYFNNQNMLRSMSPEQLDQYCSMLQEQANSSDAPSKDLQAQLAFSLNFRKQQREQELESGFNPSPFPNL
ncbi:hypothetical protein [Piscirickettsia litoralis]|uniref:Uncharacterized protein n=1 Tax=Piscirickettsia litoralis TaxID=1891921 RepID=A0ABX2ZYB1_9GAMM|nr:hypothetical protein [Piscirickettsia litoralis]ODN41591.1 hypothetical protein BGC07_15945 [Piscirickettsia litoralis]